MKQVLLVAALASLASSALTLLAAGAIRREAPSAAAPGSSADFKAALGDLEREVAALRREAAERGGAAAGSTAAPGPGEPALLRAPSPPGAPVVRDSRSTEEPVPAPDTRKRFLEILPRTPDGETDNIAREELKRRWLLRGEREVLDWFGLPQSIGPEGELETWYYSVPNGTVDDDGCVLTDDFWIKINRGRLVDLGD